jgi:hypothetical protein
MDVAEEVIGVPQHAILGVHRVQPGEIAGGCLDVQRGAAGLRDQVVGRRGTRAGLEHLEGVGDRGAVEHARSSTW